jgi:hypothetical protein
MNNPDSVLGTVQILGTCFYEMYDYQIVQKCNV